MEIQQILSEIESKAKKMSQRVQRLEAENKELRDSVFSYLVQMEAQKKEMEKLQYDMKNLQLAGNITYDRKELLKEIDRYILLVEKCMATVKVSSVIE